LVFDEVNSRRIAIFIAGLMIWVLHSFVRLALFPLSLFEESYYYWGIYLVMTLLTAVSAFYLLLVTQERRFRDAVWLAASWLIIYAIAEYAKHFYMTHQYTFPVETIPRLLYAASFILLAPVLVGLLLPLIKRKPR